jgi:MFS family permease
VHTEKQQQLPLNTPFYYGWVMVFMGAMGLFFSGPGQTFTISVFIDHYIEDFNMSRSTVSGIYSVATLAAGLFLFLMGRFIDRYGQRKMTVVVGFGLVLACFWNSFLIGPVMMFIGFFLIRLFGQGSMPLIPGTLVPQWFVKKRGRALSIMSVGIFLSSASMPPLNAWLIAQWGWPVAWRFWAFILLFLYIPLAYFLIRNKPEDVGLLPDNERPQEIEKYESTGASKEPLIETAVNNEVKEQVTNEQVKSLAPVGLVPLHEQDWTLSEAMRTRAFWLILFCAGIPAMVNTGLIFHLVSILGENGLSPGVAALVLSMMAIFSFPVNLIAGIIVERVKVHYLLAFAFVGQLVVMLLLLWTDNMQTAILFGVIRGITGGFEAISLSIVWPNYFGRKALGSIKGVSSTTMVIASAFGPLPFGLAYDKFAGYTEIILIMMLFPLLGILAALSSPAPKKKGEREQEV